MNEKYFEETIKRIEIVKNNDGLFIQILRNGYNIIQNTIYDAELAEKILKLIEEAERQYLRIPRILSVRE